MLKYVLKRLWETVPTTIGILLLTFVLFNVVGGSSAEVILGKNASAESIAAFNRKWGYDKPLLVGRFGSLEGFGGLEGCFDSQFFKFVGDLAKGDFGYSLENQEPVTEVWSSVRNFIYFMKVNFNAGFVSNSWKVKHCI